MVASRREHRWKGDECARARNSIPSERASERASSVWKRERARGVETRGERHSTEEERRQDGEAEYPLETDTPSASPFIVVLVPAVPLPLRH